MTDTAPARPALRLLTGYPVLSDAERLARVRAFRDGLATRRTVRAFSPDPVPREVIEAAIATAASAPSGANRQPWHFVAVGDPALKRQIREAAEQEERAFYAGRAPDDWLDALAPLGTDADKPFLETAPWLIVVFQETSGVGPTGEKVKNYYVPESVGIASGFLLAALHQAGLATLTHTPSPMGFLRDLLGRPANERAVMVVVAGLPAPGAAVPDIDKKPFDAVATVRADPAG
jgi:nitroreductase